MEAADERRAGCAAPADRRAVVCWACAAETRRTLRPCRGGSPVGNSGLSALCCSAASWNHTALLLISGGRTTMGGPGHAAGAPGGSRAGVRQGQWGVRRGRRLRRAGGGGRQVVPCSIHRKPGDRLEDIACPMSPEDVNAPKPMQVIKGGHPTPPSQAHSSGLRTGRRFVVRESGVTFPCAGSTPCGSAAGRRQDHVHV